MNRENTDGHSMRIESNRGDAVQCQSPSAQTVVETPLSEQEQLFLQQAFIVLLQEAEEKGSSGLPADELSSIASRAAECCREHGLAVPGAEFSQEFVKTREGIEILLRVRLKAMLEVVTGAAQSGYTRDEKLLLRSQILAGCASLGIEPPHLEFLDDEVVGDGTS